jgi:mono/diheme cytochrome c family protein
MEGAAHVLRFVKVFLIFAAGLLLFPVLAYLYLVFGHPPVAATDAPLPLEAAIVRIPLTARIHKEMPSQPPIAADNATLVAGAQIYSDKCAVCHGTPTDPSAIGKNMFPNAPQLWAKHRDGVVGVSDDPPGETYWKVKNGIRLSGMPAYGKALTERQIWQVSLLLSLANKPLPAEATQALTQ